MDSKYDAKFEKDELKRLKEEQLKAIKQANELGLEGTQRQEFFATEIDASTQGDINDYLQFQKKIADPIQYEKDKTIESILSSEKSKFSSKYVGKILASGTDTKTMSESGYAEHIARYERKAKDKDKEVEKFVKEGHNNRKASTRRSKYAEAARLYKKADEMNKETYKNGASAAYMTVFSDFKTLDTRLKAMRYAAEAESKSKEDEINKKNRAEYKIVMAKLELIQKVEDEFQQSCNATTEAEMFVGTDELCDVMSSLMEMKPALIEQYNKYKESGNKETKSFSNKVGDVSFQAREAEANVKQKNGQNEKLRKKETEAKKELEDCGLERTEAEKVLQEKKKAKNVFDSKIAEFDAKIKEVTDVKEKNDPEIIKLREALEKATKKNGDNEQQIKALKAKNDDNKKLLEQKEGDLQHSIDTKQKLLDGWIDKEIINGEIREVSEEKRKKYNRRIDETEEEITKLRKDIEVIKGDIETNKARVTVLSEQGEELSKEVKAADNKLKLGRQKYIAETENLKKEKERFKSARVPLIKEAQQNAEGGADSELFSEKVERELKEAEKNLKEKDKKYLKAQKVLSGIRENIQNNITDRDEGISNAIGAIDSLVKKINASERPVESKEEDLEQLKQYKEQLKKIQKELKGKK